MTKPELIQKVADAIDHLHASQPGSGTAKDRKAARDRANAILGELPSRWWRRVPESMVEQFQALA